MSDDDQDDGDHDYDSQADTLIPPKAKIEA